MDRRHFISLSGVSLAVGCVADREKAGSAVSEGPENRSYAPVVQHSPAGYPVVHDRMTFIEQFKYSIPRYMSRHHIKCGITGWAQVHGLIQSTPLEERIKYDIYYMENWSILLDLRIILMTVLTMKDGY